MYVIVTIGLDGALSVWGTKNGGPFASYAAAERARVRMAITDEDCADCRIMLILSGA